MKKLENRVPCPVLRYGLFGQLVNAFGEVRKGREGTISTLKAPAELISGRRKGLSLTLPVVMIGCFILWFCGSPTAGKVVSPALGTAVSPAGDNPVPKRLRDYGIKIGILEPGPYNAITDVKGVKVGHFTLIKGDKIRTGVTALLPHSGNIFREKVPAAIYLGNGYGKLTGYSQVEELGNIETPIILTNTLSVPCAADALIDYTLSFPENKDVLSVNPVVGETNDGQLNDIRGRHIKKKHVLAAIKNAADGPVPEGSLGAGTGTTCLGFKGGIGTSSRVLPNSLGGYTVGVLVQTNFGGVLQINGAPVGVELGKYYFKDHLISPPQADGSCMIVVMTDAPLDSRNLKRLAKRALLGLGKTGGILANGSGDYVIAVSTAESLRIPYKSDSDLTRLEVLRNEAMSPLFLAVIEATEEAILDSLFTATPLKSKDGEQINPLPIPKVLEILKKFNQVDCP